MTAGLKRVKVIEWYFYPEFANRKLFKKHKHANVDLQQITGKRYEELSQGLWTASSRDLGRSIGQSQWEATESVDVGPSILLDSAQSTPAKSIKSARNQQPGRFLFESAS